MTQETMLDQARQNLRELIDAARSGQVVPARLTGQLEQIDAQLELYTMQQAKAAPAPVAEDARDTAEFFKTVIHELRTPMTSIRGYGDMLANPGMAGELTDMQKQLISVIRANARRMESLLMDMSFMNKIRAGVVTVNPKMDMFKNISMMIEKKAEPLAEELKRALEFDVPQGLPILNTDADLMTTVILKLIENGLRYSPEGSGKVIVTAAAQDNNLIVTVRDNGIGMTPEELAQAGTVFYRSENETVRAHKGSGLGLPIAFGLTKALGGTLKLESSAGSGTTATLTFPGMG